MHFATVLHVRMQSQLATIRIRMWRARAAAAKSMTLVLKMISLLIVRGRPLASCSKNKQGCAKEKKWSLPRPKRPGCFSLCSELVELVVSPTTLTPMLFRSDWWQLMQPPSAARATFVAFEAPCMCVRTFCFHQIRCVQGSLKRIGVGVSMCPLRCRSPRRTATCTWSGALFCGQTNCRRTDRGGSSKGLETQSQTVFEQCIIIMTFCARTQKTHEVLLYIFCLERCRLPVSDCHEQGQDAAHQNVIAVETSHPTRGHKWPSQARFEERGVPRWLSKCSCSRSCHLRDSPDSAFGLPELACLWSGCASTMLVHPSVLSHVQPNWHEIRTFNMVDVTHRDTRCTPVPRGAGGACPPPGITEREVEDWHIEYLLARHETFHSK